MVNNKYFSRLLLDDLKKWVDRREIYAIKGPRQSGKTTLLKMFRDYLTKERTVSYTHLTLPTKRIV